MRHPKDARIRSRKLYATNSSSSTAGQLASDNPYSFSLVYQQRLLAIDLALPIDTSEKQLP